MLVSIVIPTYNRFSTTLRAVASCFDQAYKDIEVIVCDDRSDDGSFEKLADQYRDEPRVSVIQNDGMKGANAARACGVANAHGEAVAFLDSDDCLTENGIKDRVGFLEKNRECVLVYGDSISGDKVNKYDDISLYNRNKYLMRELSLCEYGVMMVRKSAFTDDGLTIDPLFKAWQDDDMILSVNRLYSDVKDAIMHCGSVVLVHNKSEVSITSNHKNLYQGYGRILEKYRQDIIDEYGRGRLIACRIRLFYRRLWIVYNESGNPFVKAGSGLLRRFLYIICRMNFKHMWG